MNNEADSKGLGELRGAGTIMHIDDAAAMLAQFIQSKTYWVINAPGDLAGHRWLDKIGLCATWSDSGIGMLTLHIDSGATVRKLSDAARDVVAQLMPAVDLSEAKAAYSVMASVVAVPKDQIGADELSALLGDPTIKGTDRDIIMLTGLQVAMVPELFLRAMELYDPPVAAQIRAMGAGRLN